MMNMLLNRKSPLIPRHAVAKYSPFLEELRKTNQFFIMAGCQKERTHFAPEYGPLAEILPHQISKDHLLVKVTRTSICQTDRRVLAQQKESSIHNNRICLGHEGGGIVVDTNSEKIEVGQKVVFLPHYTCMKCVYCLAGNTNLCPNMKHMGIHIHGTFSPYMCVPTQCVYPLKESFHDDFIPLIEPLSCVIRAWSHFEKNSVSILNENRELVIYGAGPMGVLAALWGKYHYPNLKIQLVDPNPYRQATVKQFVGFNVVSHYARTHALSWVASSNIEAYHQSVESSLSDGFVLAFSGVNSKDLMDAKNKNHFLPLLYEKIHRKELHLSLPSLPSNKRLTMIGSSGYNLKNIKTTIDELDKNGAYYSQVQNIAINGLNNNMIEMLKTNETMELSATQAQTLKILVRM